MVAALTSAGWLPLDEAMKDWSPARIRAYLGRKENPNAYYYRSIHCAAEPL
jgi:hypothetical protein